MIKAKDFIANSSRWRTECSAFAYVRQILDQNPDGSLYFNVELQAYQNAPARFSINLEELEVYSNAYLFITSAKGIDDVQDWLESAESIETEFASRLGSEYKRSSDNPDDPAFLLHDDGQWYPSTGYNNGQLNCHELYDVAKFRNALHKLLECKRYQSPLEFTKALFKRNGIEKGWVDLQEMVETGNGALVQFGYEGSLEFKQYLEAHNLIQSYGGLEKAATELRRLRIPRWITPEITSLENAFKIMDHFHEKPICEKKLDHCKRYLMGHCRPKCMVKLQSR